MDIICSEQRLSARFEPYANEESRSKGPKLMILAQAASDTVDLVIIVCYLVGIMAIGIWAGYRRKTSSTQFFLAGRSLKWPMIGAALFTANISTIHLVGLAADGFSKGIVVGNFEWMASFCLIVLGMCVAAYVVLSLLTPAPTADELKKMGWESPLRSITSGKLTGITDPRLMAGVLFVIVIILYCFLR